MHAQLGQIINNNIQKGPNPTAISEVREGKAGCCPWSQYTAPQRGWADGLSHLSSPTHQSTPSHLRGPAQPLRAASKGTCYLFLLPYAWISALLTMPKPLTVRITINCGKFWKRWEYQTTWPASWEICMQVRKQQLERDMKQQTGSK